MFYNQIEEEYIRYREKYEEIPKDDPMSVYLRGQSFDWPVMTTLHRFYNGEVTPGNLCMGMWNPTKSVFSNIAYMQHYGKATRFLDFTKSLPVAVYFACADKTQENENGVIYMCAYTVRKEYYPDSLVIEKLLQLTREISLTQFVEGVFGNRISQEQKREESLSILGWINHGFMVEPSCIEKESIKVWNKRLYAQDGAFFVAGNKTIPADIKPFSTNIDNTKICPQLASIPSTVTTSPYVDKIIIPSEEKKSLLMYLDSIGINGRTLYLES